MNTASAHWDLGRVSDVEGRLYPDSGSGHGSVATVAYTRGGWVRGQKRVCVPKIDVQFWAPLIDLIFLPQESFLMWVGGWAGQAEEPRLPPPPQR